MTSLNSGLFEIHTNVERSIIRTTTERIVAMMKNPPHPGAMPVGWRLPGTSDRGDTRMFDWLEHAPRGEGQLLHTYL